ncbi:MAG: hypothetical protein GOU97_03100 [Nanoarchaeota archaeon]|nr:hypothetical protein [Nanoarchaeota archaeon]
MRGVIDDLKIEISKLYASQVIGNAYERVSTPYGQTKTGYYDDGVNPKTRLSRIALEELFREEVERGGLPEGFHVSRALITSTIPRSLFELRFAQRIGNNDLFVDLIAKNTYAFKDAGTIQEFISSPEYVHEAFFILGGKKLDYTFRNPGKEDELIHYFVGFGFPETSFHGELCTHYHIGDFETIKEMGAELNKARDQGEVFVKSLTRTLERNIILNPEVMVKKQLELLTK